MGRDDFIASLSDLPSGVTVNSAQVSDIPGSTWNINFSGDVQTIKDKEAFLHECSHELYPIKCTDVSSPMIVTVEGTHAALSQAIESIQNEGIFNVYTFPALFYQSDSSMENTLYTIPVADTSGIRDMSSCLAECTTELKMALSPSSTASCLKIESPSNIVVMGSNRLIMDIFAEGFSTKACGDLEAEEVPEYTTTTVPEDSEKTEDESEDSSGITITEEQIQIIIGVTIVLAIICSLCACGYRYVQKLKEKKAKENMENLAKLA